RTRRTRTGQTLPRRTWTDFGPTTSARGWGRTLGCGRTEPEVSSDGDLAQRIDLRLLARHDALDPVAERGLEHADALDQRGELARFHRRGLIRAPHRGVERDVAFDGDGTERRGGEGDLEAELVAGVADGHTVALPHGGDRCEVDLFGRQRIRRGGVHEHEPVAVEDLDGAVEGLPVGHARGAEDGLAGG